MSRNRWFGFGLLMVSLLTSVALVGCQPAVKQERGTLSVVATTTIVADVAQQIAGDALTVTSLLPVGVDPHGFSPTPRDVSRVAEADVVFANGAGLEEFLDQLLMNAGGHAEVIYVSDGIALLEADLADAQHRGDDEDAHEHAAGDPHTWTTPANVMAWVDAIEAALVRHDPEHAAAYRANAVAYREQLQELDGWVQAQIAQIAEPQRLLVTDHTTFTYLAERYGLRQIGTIIPGYSTLSQPSAQDLVGLENLVREYGVKAIFVGKTVNPALAEQVAADTGMRLVPLYTGSLTERDGEAGTYLAYMRYNVEAIVEALK